MAITLSFCRKLKTMTLLKFENYKIEKVIDKKATSNYDAFIHIFRDKKLIKGYSVKSTTDNKVLIEQALKLINIDEEVEKLTLF